MAAIAATAAAAMNNEQKRRRKGDDVIARFEFIELFCFGSYKTASGNCRTPR
jgi:hypothetical protein